MRHHTRAGSFAVAVGSDRLVPPGADPSGDRPHTKKGPPVATDPLDEAVDALADDASIDWAALERDSVSPEAREEAKWLRILAEIADHHRAAYRGQADAETVTIDPLKAVTSRPAAPSPPTWGRFELLELIGEGGYGSVYRAWNPDLQMELAIKLLHRRVADRTPREQLLEEGRALARIQHENVVRVLGIESHGDRIGLCMELVPGQTLDAYLGGRGVLNDREATQIAQQLCRALVAVHGAGFVHRDVKARNIMRCPDGRIVLMDFGTGFRLRPDGAAAFEVIGTPRYMAPEVLRSEPPSPCSDVYSAGVLIYHLVTGGYPVEGATFDELHQAHAANRRHTLDERRGDLPRAFRRAVATALSPAPVGRFQTAAAMLDAFERLSRKRSVFRVLAESVVFALAIATGWMVLGTVNSLVFNVVLGRSAFANEGWLDNLRWGARSTLAPGVLIMISFVGLTAVMALRRLVLRLSGRARALETAALAWVRAKGLADVGVLSACALILSASALAIATWAFSPLIVGLLQIFPSISSAPLEAIQYLSPQLFSYHENYRVTFTWMTIGCLAAWYPALTQARRTGERINRGLAAGGLTVALFSVVLLNFPYRLFSQSHFEAATWQGQGCYILGTRGDEWLLFCPEMPPPRNRIVNRATNEIHHGGVIEKIFDRIPIQAKD
jgi:hypothetical protein